jgi:NAD(P)-dependent dehydrogenase (short-subunit alcohol dehydrogenase family)
LNSVAATDIGVKSMLIGAALVTGGGRRIGRALALALADAGLNVAVHYRGSASEALEVVGAIQALGRKAAVVPADLSNAAETNTLVARAAEAVGPLNVLVNNASLFQNDSLQTLTPEGWDAHFETNLRAPIFLAQAFAAQVSPDLPDGEAMILNLLDQRVLKLNPQFFSYTLTKAALWTATRTLAQALAPRIRVNGLGPGPTLASIHQDADIFAAEVAATPLGRPVSPDDICAAALYLLRSRAVTGQMIAVDSGQHLTWRTPDILD